MLTVAWAFGDCLAYHTGAGMESNTPGPAAARFCRRTSATVRAPVLSLYSCFKRVITSRGMASEENPLTNFGILIAYVLPGFTALEGFPLISPVRPAWGAGADPNPSLTVFLSGTVEALAAGLTVSTVRWLLIDTLHHCTGLARPAWDFSRLDKNVAAFEYLVHIHYRYYKFYANMVVALVWAYATREFALGWRGLLYWPLAVLFFFASRDTLRKCYERTWQLLRPTAGGHAREA